jgi:hypothetical protein
MASGSKKRQTMAKMTRERTVSERRARKQEKREERKQAALLGLTPDAADSTVSEPADEEEKSG